MFDSIELVLSRYAHPSPVVSLLEIHVSEQDRVDSPSVNSMLRLAVPLDPEKLVITLPSRSISDQSIIVDLPCFHRATSIVLENFDIIHCVLADIKFNALEALSLSRCKADLDALLSYCPHLHTLHLSGLLFETWNLRVNSSSLQELIVDTIWAQRVNIVAPILKKLTMIFIPLSELKNVSVLAPMLEMVEWHCTYSDDSIVFGLWKLELLRLPTTRRQGKLRSLCIHACAKLSLLPHEPTFAKEIEKHIIVNFSHLKLYLQTGGHIFGALVFYLLTINRIASSMKRLKIVLLRSVVKEECPMDCPCVPMNWRTQTISLTALEEVEINGFNGEDHEFDLLELILICAPMLKRIILRLSHEVLPSENGCTTIYDISRVNSSVKCYLYLSSGLVHHSQDCP
uniref:F-box/LRR-repeat protein 15/At3g58940/PEG3-like LRR domain-containing protein n=1 Tax=Triticum urartu TaxID=4572 RepID=A0A8R7R5M5_TRIUA